MAEDGNGNMNLDLNLGLRNNSSDAGDSRLESYDVSVNLEDLLVRPVPRVAPVFRPRTQRWRSIWRQIPIPPEAQNLALELFVGNVPHTGQGSIAGEVRPAELGKMSENGHGNVETEYVGKKEDGKNNGDEGSFFDCNICLDLAKDPVLTCCGHLFCWPCLYRWIRTYSDAKECPVCKGEVSIKNVTPIYGRGNHMLEPCMDSSLKIPLRPQARRIESWRQTIQRTAFPMEEMIRRLEESYDFNRESTQIQPQMSDRPRESPDRNDSLLDLIFASRGLVRSQTLAIPSDNVIDLSESSPPNFDVGDYIPRPRILRRIHSHRASTLPNPTTAMNSAESLAADRLVDMYYHNSSAERNQGRALLFDDRDSVSSIAAVIHSESQTVDNTIEIDSNISLSTSSSRRRHESSRHSEGDSGESRVPRRRLN